MKFPSITIALSNNPSKIITIIYIHAWFKSAEILDLSSKDEVSPLCVGQEDDEEHHCKASNVFCTLLEWSKQYT